MDNEFIVCQKCGEQNPVANNFCKKCANPLKEIQPPQTIQPPTKPPKRTAMGCLIMLGIVIVIIISIVLSTRGCSKTSSTDTSSASASKIIVNISGDIIPSTLRIGGQSTITMNIQNTSSVNLNGVTLRTYADIKDFTIVSTSTNCSYNSSTTRFTIPNTIVPNETLTIKIIVSPNVAGNKDIRFRLLESNDSTEININESTQAAIQFSFAITN